MDIVSASQFRRSLWFCVYLWLIFLMLVTSSAGADVSVTLKLDRTEATIADSIRLSVSVSGARKSEPPAISGLELFDVSGGGTSSRVEIINGKVNSSVDYTYGIQPKKTGTFTIGPAEVKVKGNTIASNTATLIVIEPGQASSGVNRGPVFLSAALSSTKVYVDAQTIYTLKLYSQVSVDDISLSLPEVQYLTFEQLGKHTQYESVYNAEPYQVLEVRYALIPSREGVYGVRPSRMSMRVFQPRRRAPRSLFDDPFFSLSSGRPMTVASEPLELDVRSLPQKGRPADFSGLVGSYEIEAKLEPTEVKARESATLTVLLSGRGNVNRIPDLKMPELDQVKVYADQPVLTEAIDAEGLAGSKTMKWALVPEKEGDYEVPSLSVSFFDTGSQAYQTIKTPLLTLSVLPGEKEQALISADALKEKHEGDAKKEVKELGHDILPVHTSLSDFSSGSRAGTGELLFWTILIVPILIYAATFSVLKLQKRSYGSLAATKAKKAARNFLQQFRQGELGSSDMISSIRQYLNERFDLSLGTLTANEAVDILRSRRVSFATAERLRKVIESLEDAIYTGKGRETCEIGENIPDLIKQIEKEIR